MGLSGNYWPAHPKPFPDEIFSSWLIRTAHKNGPGLHSFCHLVWPHRQIWTRDIDRIVALDLLDKMSQKTGANRDGLECLFLQHYEGKLFIQIATKALNQWIRYIGVKHRLRTQHGQLYCPLCLEGDAIPYFRKLWRTNLSPVCLEHSVVLRDCCDKCGSTVMPHRGKMIECSECGYDLRDARAWFAHPEALKLAQALVARANGMRLWGMAVPKIEQDIEFFQTTRIVMSMLCSGIRAGWLRHEASKYLGKPVRISTAGRYRTQFEYLRVSDLHDAFAMSSILFRGWPWMLIGLCSQARLWKSWALADKDGYNISVLKNIFDKLIVYEPENIK